MQTEYFDLEDDTVRFLEPRLLQLQALQSELNGALALLIHQHELKGRWQLDWPHRRLVRTDAIKEVAA